MLLGAPSHQEQIEAARAIGLQLTAAQERAFLELLREYSAELEAMVAGQLGRVGLVRTRQLVQQLLDRLTEELARSVVTGVRLTSRRVAELHAEATLSLLDLHGEGAPLRAAVRTTFEGIPVGAARAVLARPALAAAIRSIRVDARAAADRVLRTGMLRSAGPEEIGRALRLHLVGAEAFPAGALRDLRRVGYGTLEAMGLDATPENLARVREKAGALARRARLIARTEIMAAEHEAGVQAAIASPVVAGVQWYLSHRHPEPDECVPAGTLITTETGERPIEEVQLGDWVLTHLGRWRPVVRLYRRTIRAGRLVQLRCRAGRSRTQELTLTPNHPVLTARGWIPAGDLRAGMRVAILPSTQPAPAVRSPCDTGHTAGPGSGGSGPSHNGETAALGRCGADRPAPHRKSHSDHRGAPAPRSLCTCVAGTARQASGRPSSADCPCLDAPERTAPGSLPASATHLSNGGHHSSGSRGRVRSVGRPRSSSASWRAAAERAGRSAHTPAEGGGDTRASSSSGARLRQRSVARSTSSRSQRTAPLPGLVAPPPYTPDCRSDEGDSETCTAARSAVGSARNTGPCPQCGAASAVSQWSEIECLSISTAAESEVFNLGVDEDHSYAAEGIFVHNCDVLAGQDFYGLGPGVYPPERVPLRPHPRCLCGRRHVLREPAEWGTARAGAPALQANLDEVAEAYRLSPSKAASLTQALGRPAAPDWGAAERPLLREGGADDTLRAHYRAHPDEAPVRLPRSTAGERGLAAASRRVRLEPNEVAVAVDRQGKLLFTASSNRRDLVLEEDLMPKLKQHHERLYGITHSHPSDGPFSFVDVELAIDWNLEWLHGSGPAWINVMGAPAGGWSFETAARFLRRRSEMAIQVRRELRLWERYAEESLSAREANVIFLQELWARLMPEFGIEYRRQQWGQR